MSGVDAHTRPGGLRRALTQLRRSPVGTIGAFMVTSVLIAALLSPVLSPHDPTEHNRSERFEPPVWMEGGSPEYLLGTDQLGRDVLSRLLYGSRISVAVGVAAVIIGGTLGALFGLLAGLYGGWIDTVISRAIDTFLALPFLILVLAVIGILGPSLMTIILRSQPHDDHPGARLHRLGHLCEGRSGRGTGHA
ncbi:MAG: ABC transporter permease [Thioalkalivibrio sp.]|nr:ABC transporter permease [Thioalkalivibrio sp.]